MYQILSEVHIIWGNITQCQHNCPEKLGKTSLVTKLLTSNSALPGVRIFYTNENIFNSGKEWLHPLPASVTSIKVTFLSHLNSVEVDFWRDTKCTINKTNLQYFFLSLFFRILVISTLLPVFVRPQTKHLPDSSVYWMYRHETDIDPTSSRISSQTASKFPKILENF